MCVLTVKSKLPNVSVMDFCAIVPHWDVSEGFRAAVSTSAFLCVPISHPDIIYPVLSSQHRQRIAWLGRYPCKQ